MVGVSKRYLAALCLALLMSGEATAQQTLPPAMPGDLQISWEVRNRFRLFREERDFLLQVEALRGKDILASEDTLSIQSDGRGWARNTFGRLCIDQTGRVNEPCLRDNVRESYLTPTEHPVTVRLTGNIPVGATCAWLFDDGGEPRRSALDCTESINFRARYGLNTKVSVDVSSGADPVQHATGDIMVRDIFIAGLGDSIGSGEGNPDRAIALADDGFCFRSYAEGATGQYYRPGRERFTGGRACETTADSMQSWQRLAAQWLNPACHRSLYSYQTRTAIALAVRFPHIAVTYLPLACSGATISEGLLGNQRARECVFRRSETICEGTVNGQFAELRDALTAAKRRQPDRQLDLILLSIGANDIDFSGLVADVIVDGPTERALLQRAGGVGSVDESRSLLARDLPRGFARMREALKPLIGSDLSRVVFTSYGNPTFATGAPCPGGPAGFDVHPAFNADPTRLANVANFVQNEFLPRLKSIATCRGGVLCRDPNNDALTFVDQHQAAFANHGFCARAASDPEFDRQCFSATGDSFTSNLVAAAANPMTCGQGASNFRAYLPRARWIRDANDAYFTAMTYPQGTRSSAQPANIHDANWGILSAVYGGAIHPTAEGHAAMADATLPAAIALLGLGPTDAPVVTEPLPPAQ